jgi:hypothetical protein
MLIARRAADGYPWNTRYGRGSARRRRFARWLRPSRRRAYAHENLDAAIVVAFLNGVLNRSCEPYDQAWTFDTGSFISDVLKRQMIDRWRLDGFAYWNLPLARFAQHDGDAQIDLQGLAGRRRKMPDIKHRTREIGLYHREVALPRYLQRVEDLCGGDRIYEKQTQQHACSYPSQAFVAHPLIPPYCPDFELRSFLVRKYAVLPSVLWLLPGNHNVISIPATIARSVMARRPVARARTVPELADGGVLVRAWPVVIGVAAGTIGFVGSKLPTDHLVIRGVATSACHARTVSAWEKR